MGHTKLFNLMKGHITHQDHSIKVEFIGQTTYISVGAWANCEVQSEDEVKPYIKQLNKAVRFGLWKFLDGQKVFSTKLFMMDFSLPSSTFVKNGKTFLSIDYTLYKIKKETPTIEEVNTVLNSIMDTLHQDPHFTYSLRK